MLLEESERLLLSFFCHKVEKVIAKRLIKAAKTPFKGRLLPISNPKTRAAPKKPKTIPIHCNFDIFSFNKGPAKMFVNTGCNVTIKAVIPVGIPIEIE